MFSLDSPRHQTELPLLKKSTKIEPFDGISVAGVEEKKPSLAKGAPTNKSRIGIYYQLGSSLCVVSTSALRKLIPEVSTAQAIFLRGPFILAVIIGILYYTNKIKALKESFELKMPLIGALASASGMCFFTAMIHMPLGDIMTIVSTTAILSGILSAVLLGEPYKLKERILGLISFFGIFLVIRPPFIFGGETQAPVAEGGMPRSVAACLALVPVFCDSAVAVTMRSTKGKYHALCPPFYVNLVMFIIFGTTLFYTGGFKPVTFNEMLIIFLFGMTNLLAFYLCVKALETETAATTGLISYTSPIYSIIVDMIAFSTYPSFLSLVGATLIIGSCTYLILSKSK